MTCAAQASRSNGPAWRTCAFALTHDQEYASADSSEGLRVRLEPRLTGYQLVRLGRIVRIEWDESDAALLDAARLDEVLEAIADAFAHRNRAHR